MNDNIKWLTTVPASDGNFVSHLKSATEDEIKEAIYAMNGVGTKGNASRIAACSRELRRRKKEK